MRRPRGPGGRFLTADEVLEFERSCALKISSATGTQDGPNVASMHKSHNDHNVHLKRSAEMIATPNQGSSKRQKRTSSCHFLDRISPSQVVHTDDNAVAGFELLSSPGKNVQSILHPKPSLQHSCTKTPTDVALGYNIAEEEIRNSEGSEMLILTPTFPKDHDIHLDSISTDTRGIYSETARAEKCLADIMLSTALNSQQNSLNFL